LRQIYPGKRLKLYLIFLTTLTIIFSTTKIAIGQKLFVEVAESNVFVKRNNLVRAKANALKDAKTQVILQAIARYLDYNSMVSLEPILLKHFLEFPDFFIESIRVTNEGHSNDFSQFKIKIETQIFRSRILSTFRKLGIPTQEEKFKSREIFLLYNANNALRKKRIFSKISKNLQIRLNPYKIKAIVIDIKEKNITIESGLASRISLLPNNSTKNDQGKILALLELKLKLSPGLKNSQQGKIETQLIFWPQNEEHTNPPIFFTKARVNQSFSVWNEKNIIPEILDKLMLQWTPIILKTFEFNKGSGKNVNLKFRGVPGPIEEQLLFKSIFQNNPRWEKINLDVISKHYVTYKGIFLGNKKEILRELRQKNDSQYFISSANWEDNFLVIDLIWKEIVTKLEKFNDTHKENELIDTNYNAESKLKPVLKVPLRTFKQTYRLPLGNPVFDHIRHRGDSTLFRIERPLINDANDKKSFLKIIWNRLGPTNLRPKITIFDEKKKSIKSYNLGKKTELFFKYELPSSMKTFYLRISDELGFLEDVSGSYQSFRYVLTTNLGEG